VVVIFCPNFGASSVAGRPGLSAPPMSKKRIKNFERENEKDGLKVDGKIPPLCTRRSFVGVLKPPLRFPFKKARLFLLMQK